MIKYLKRLFKRNYIIVYKDIKPKKFKSFEKAVAYMLSNNL